MAMWQGAARTNYFRVIDEAAFRAAMEALPDLLIVSQDDRFAVMSDAEDGGFSSTRYVEATDDWEEIDLADAISEHLAVGEVAVLMEAGHEKLRYVSGFAVAINADGERRQVVLSDIYKLAEELGPNVTGAEY